MLLMWQVIGRKLAMVGIPFLIGCFVGFYSYHCIHRNQTNRTPKVEINTYKEFVGELTTELESSDYLEHYYLLERYQTNE